MRRTVGLITLLIVAALAPTLVAHGGNTIGLEARERQCPDDEAICLSLFSIAAATQPGDQVELMVRNLGSSNSSYTIHVAPLADADPDRRDTPASAAFVEVGPVPPGGTEEVTFTLPDAPELYAWSDEDDDEAQGMHETITLRATDSSVDRSAPGPGAALLAAALVVGVLVRRHRV